MIDPQSPLLASVQTPALVLECGPLDANIRRMAAAASTAGVALRPHAKSHKCVEIAQRQIAAGAVGICCATILEAEGLVKAGIDKLLVTSPLSGTDKVSRLVTLHRKAPIMTVVDHRRQVDAIVALLNDEDAPMGILVDVDVGQCRTGVASAEAGVELAKYIARSGRLWFAGLQAFGGQIQHIIDYEHRRSAAQEAAQAIRAMRDQLGAEGLLPLIVSGSGTGTSAFDFSAGIFTELQVGSYIFMDADYGRLREMQGTALPYERSLFVMATVVSVNRAGQVTVDAGTKALAVNGPLPDNIVGAPEGTAYRFAGDEHGILQLSDVTKAPDLGARVLIGVTHCDPTVNLYRSYVASCVGGAVEHWRIVGRYGNAA